MCQRTASGPHLLIVVLYKYRAWTPIFRAPHWKLKEASIDGDGRDQGPSCSQKCLNRPPVHYASHECRSCIDGQTKQTVCLPVLAGVKTATKRRPSRRRAANQERPLQGSYWPAFLASTNPLFWAAAHRPRGVHRPVCGPGGRGIGTTGGPARASEVTMSSYPLLPNFPLCKPSHLPISAHHFAALPCKISHGPSTNSSSLFFIFINTTFLSLFFLLSFACLVVLSLNLFYFVPVSSSPNLARAVVCPFLVRKYYLVHDDPFEFAPPLPSPNLTPWRPQFQSTPTHRSLARDSCLSFPPAGFDTGPCPLRAPCS